MTILDLSRTDSFRALVFACCIVAVLFVDTSTNVAMSEEATKEETIEYITRQFTRHANACHFYKSTGSYGELSISPSGVMRWSETLTSFPNEGRVNKFVYQYEANVSDFDLNEIEIEKVCSGDRRLNGVRLWCLSGECISETRYTHFRAHVEDGRIKKSADQRKSATLTFPSDKVAESVAKAFRHLIKLYGGKGSKELFD